MNIPPADINRTRIASQVLVFATAGSVLWCLWEAQKSSPLPVESRQPTVVPEKRVEPEEPEIPVISTSIFPLSVHSNILPVTPSVIDWAILSNPEQMLEESLWNQLVDQIVDMLWEKSPLSQEYRIDKIWVDEGKTTCIFVLKDGKTLSYNYGREPVLVIDGVATALTAYPRRDMQVKRCIDSYLANLDVLSQPRVS
jgi:hypothetical protein